MREPQLHSLIHERKTVYSGMEGMIPLLWGGPSCSPAAGIFQAWSWMQIPYSFLIEVQKPVHYLAGWMLLNIHCKVFINREHLQPIFGTHRLSALLVFFTSTVSCRLATICQALRSWKENAHTNGPNRKAPKGYVSCRWQLFVGSAPAVESPFNLHWQSSNIDA